MNTRYIEEFLVFAESLNYSAAAKQLFITRGTLHEHIVQLENKLGVALIEKKANGAVRLTSMGEHFLADGRGVVKLVNEVVGKYGRLRDNALTLSIGSVDFAWLEPFIYLAREKYLHENPGKSVEFVSVDRGLVEDSLAEDVVDIVVVSRKCWCDNAGNMDGVVLPCTQSFCIGEEETFLLVPSTHPLYERSEIYARDLDGADIVLPQNIVDWWKRDGVVGAVAAAGGSVILEGVNFKNLSTYFAYDFKDRLGGVSQAQVARSGVEMRSDFSVMRMQDLPIVSKFYAVFKDQLLENENSRRFMECFREVAAQTHAASWQVGKALKSSPR